MRRALIAFLVGCGSSAGICEVGVPSACRCDDGREGVSICGADGTPGACTCGAIGPPDQSWSRAFGDAADQARIAVAAGPAGIAVVGSFEGTIGFGGLPLVSRGARDVFVALLDPSGAHVWSRSYGSEGDDEALAVAVDEAGIFVTGYFSGAIDFGGHPAESLGHADAFALAIAPTGEVRWTKTYGSARFDQLAAVAVGPDGAVHATGHFQGRIEAESGIVTPVAGTDALVVRLEADGEEAFIGHLGGSGDTQGYAVVAALGGATIGGRLDGSISGLFGETTLGEDVFVAAVDAGGGFAAIETHGGPGADRLTDMALGASLLLCGHFEETAGFGPDREVAIESAGESDAFAVLLDPTGQVTRARSFGGTLAERLWSCDLRDDTILIGGSFTGAIDLGDGLRVAEDEDAFVAELTADLELVRAMHWGDGGRQVVRSVAYDRDADRLIVAGTFEGTIAPSGQPLVSAGGRDLFVAALR